MDFYSTIQCNYSIDAGKLHVCVCVYFDGRKVYKW